MSPKNTWLIVSLQTGAMDGFYSIREMALAAYERRCESIPHGAWLLVKVHEAQNHKFVLPDHLFWSEVYSQCIHKREAAK